MYTSKTTEIAKLRAYRQEVGVLYADALRRRDRERALALAESRRRVVRAILLYQEYNVEHSPEPIGVADC